NVQSAVLTPKDSQIQADTAIFLLTNAVDALMHIGEEDLLIETSELMKVYQSLWTILGDGDDIDYDRCSLTDPNAAKYPLWNTSETYLKDELVNYNNLVWRATWWNVGANPASAEAPWLLVSDVEYPWQSVLVYDTGDELNHNGRRWRAKWWVRG